MGLQIFYNCNYPEASLTNKMETDGEKGFLREQSRPAGATNEAIGRAAVNLKPGAGVSSPVGSCPNTSFLNSGRACSPSPAVQRPRACQSPISSIVGTALNQYAKY